MGEEDILEDSKFVSISEHYDMPIDEHNPVYDPKPLKEYTDKSDIHEYDIESAEDIQYALKDLLEGTIKGMMEAEMDNHLGYERSARSESDNARNGYK